MDKKQVVAIARETEGVTVERVKEKEGFSSVRERKRERGTTRGQRNGELVAGGVFLLAT